MEPNKHTTSDDEPAMSHSLPELSALPEPVLIHILSFMDPKEAVQTCILSKQWRNLWTHIPSLNFEFKRFGVRCTTAAFVHFVANMLYFRGASKMDTFRLRWHAGSQHQVSSYSDVICEIHVSNASSWIFSALRCKPRVISLDFLGFTNLKLPHALFTCTSLEQLELKLSNRYNEETIGPKYVNLPNLKKLKLSVLTLKDPVMQEILWGCPLLEELSLSECILKFNKMKSDCLRHLTIKRCPGFGAVEIFMPSLISVHLEDSCPGVNKLSLKNTPSLVKVFISYEYFHEHFFSSAEFEFFNSLTTVTDLELYDTGVKALLEKIIPNCPVLDNLKRLTFGKWLINEKLDLLCQLLQHTPNLEKLTVVHKKPTNPGRIEKKRATGQIPFKCKQLKAIEIKYSDPSGVHELVDILVRNTSHGEKSVRIDFSRF
ncbi:F-box/RNI-like superfamily protein [Rhynchospora pubera]|uniref:F-box/RNI-like superfamily protein n=1 Tax=Rhynchospora pubera TaxID=906938 RepID=A0AAV8FZP9_9POAL|nr:F-box/RNI-like superfamily protein [Rhynchospora pubera]